MTVSMKSESPIWTFSGIHTIHQRRCFEVFVLKSPIFFISYFGFSCFLPFFLVYFSLHLRHIWYHSEWINFIACFFHVSYLLFPMWNQNCSPYSGRLLQPCQEWKPFPPQNRKTWLMWTWSLMSILLRQNSREEVVLARECTYIEDKKKRKQLEWINTQIKSKSN